MKLAETKQKGFTLIELLVVIAIIGMLSSVVLASMNSARVKARDARRLADMKQIQAALELYNNDHQGYPDDGGSTPNKYVLSEISNTFINGGYIAKLPKDPSRSGVDGDYKYSASTSGSTDARPGYLLLMFHEDTGDWCKVSSAPSDPPNTWWAGKKFCSEL